MTAKLKQVQFGRAGMKVSELALGAWMFGHQFSTSAPQVVDEDTAHTILNTAAECGLNFIDTANRYGDGRSETYIGSWLKGQARENYILASKVYYSMLGLQQIGLSRKIIRAEIEGSLRRLQTDFLDIYYIHCWHDASPLEEALDALNDLVHEGKVHYLGVSNFTAWQMVQAHMICQREGWAPISVIQPRFNAVDNVPFSTIDPQEIPLPDLFDACRYHGIAVCPYAPLAGGFLTGKYRLNEDGMLERPEGSRSSAHAAYGGFPERWWRVLATIQDVAKETGASTAQVALRWAMDVPGLTSVPIIGATSAVQLKETLAAASVALSAAQHKRISSAGHVSDVDGNAYGYAD